MKINEIDDKHNLDEGPLDWLKAKMPIIGQQSSGSRDSGRIAKILIQRWQGAVGQHPDLANKPEALKSFMTKSTAGSGIKIPDPTDMSPSGAAAYITDLTGQAQAARTTGFTGQPGEEDPAGSNTPTYNSPLSGGQPTATSPPVAQSTTPQLAAGVELYNDEPMMLKWNKGIYQVLDDGRWHQVQPQYNKNPVDPATEQFLTQQADKATPESPVAPAQSSAQQPPAQQQQQRQQPPAPTPAEIRQAKQAAAANTAQAQMNAPETPAPATNSPTVPASTTPAPEAPAPRTTTPNFGTGVGPGVKPQMTVTPTMANNASLPSGEFGWSNPTNPNYVGRREVARRKSAYLPQTNDRGQVEPAMYEESIDLGEVLWRKIKSRRR